MYLNVPRYLNVYFLNLGIRKPRRHCKGKYLEGKRKSAVPNGFTSNVFCAKEPNHVSGSCPGDSGKLKY